MPTFEITTRETNEATYQIEAENIDEAFDKFWNKTGHQWGEDSDTIEVEFVTFLPDKIEAVPEDVTEEWDKAEARYDAEVAALVKNRLAESE